MHRVGEGLRKAVGLLLHGRNKIADKVEYCRSIPKQSFTTIKHKIHTITVDYSLITKTAVHFTRFLELSMKR